jgi:hypothetical protein
MLQESSSADAEDIRSAATRAALAALDDCCLGLCISLLDHELKGDLFESVVVGFFAVSAIDVRKGILKVLFMW